MYNSLKHYSLTWEVYNRITEKTKQTNKKRHTVQLKHIIN